MKTSQEAVGTIKAELQTETDLVQAIKDEIASVNTTHQQSIGATNAELAAVSRRVEEYVAKAAAASDSARTACVHVCMCACMHGTDWVEGQVAALEQLLVWTQNLVTEARAELAEMNRRTGSASTPMRRMEARARIVLSERADGESPRTRRIPSCGVGGSEPRRRRSRRGRSTRPCPKVPFRFGLDTSSVYCLASRRDS